jgi:hypothetical protein
MLDRWERLKEFVGRLVNGVSTRPTRRGRKLHVEALEERCCPTGVWQWIGAGGNANWSNSANWQIQDPATGLFVAPAANQPYPGVLAQPPQPGQPQILNSFNDVVEFNSIVPPPAATLDVPINTLSTLQFTGWTGTLTLNNSLTVASPTAPGQFDLADGSNIALTTNTSLSLINLPNVSTLNSGSITNAPGATGTSVNVVGCELDIQGTPGGLAPNLAISGIAAVDGQPAKNGIVQLSQMANNLTLTGASNYIDVQGGGFLDLSQSVVNGTPLNSTGGIAFGAGHTAALAVEVESGGTLNCMGVPQAGVKNQVSIAGAVYNDGGTVSVSGGDFLAITGQDANGYSYWQYQPSGAPAPQVAVGVGNGGGAVGTNALLQVGAGGNINAVGTYEIDGGTVQLAAVGTDELDGAGLNFGSSDPTDLDIVDFNSTPSTVIVQGSVTLGALTLTQMNLTGANPMANPAIPNATDMLMVLNGSLTLNGWLYFFNLDAIALTAACNCFESVGVGAGISGAFWGPITDSSNAAYAGNVVPNNPTQFYFQV